MSLTVEQIGLHLDVRLHAETLVTNGIDHEMVLAALGERGFPGIQYGAGSDTVGGLNIDFIATGITNSFNSDDGIIPITFSSVLAQDGVAIGNGAKIKYAFLFIYSPTVDDSSIIAQVLPGNDLSACAFGLAPIATAAMNFYRQFIYVEPKHGTVGNKINLFNSGGNVAIRIAYLLAGTRA